jgi:ADP-ribose pyrophosphatase
VRTPDAVRTLYRGRYVQVDAEDWGDERDYEVVRQLGAAAVLPVTPDGRAIFVRQFRPPVRDSLLEIPAGLLDVNGEDALTCASRELKEETGYEHTHIAFLGGVFVSPGSTDHYVHLFVATTTEGPVGAPEEGLEVVTEPLDRMVNAARAGRIRDAKTALALLLVDGKDLGA